jgi:hypothetical protein
MPSHPTFSSNSDLVVQKALLRLTAAGTAPELNRIPFSLPIPDLEQVIPKNVAKIEIQI